MSKVIHVRLNKQSIADAIQQVEKYRQDLIQKNAEFAEKLKEYGIEVVSAQMEGIPNPTGIGYGDDPGTDTWSFDTSGSNVEANGVVATANINVGGNRILYVEFGYGAVFGNPQHPKAGEFGYGMGTNSPAGHWDDPAGWWYNGTDGKAHHTYGAPAYMPVYNASVHIRSHVDDIRRIAKGVFGNG